MATSNIATIKPAPNSHTPMSASDEVILGNYHLTQRIVLDSAGAVITKWQSQITGLRVVHIDCHRPLINGWFAVPTESFNDTGCPHALEHLTFCGSKQSAETDELYQPAFHGLCSRANAYTRVDRTVYSVSSADEDSFLRVLPVYADHILYPTLTDESFRTEVYNVDEKGDNNGVVFCEMQAKENRHTHVRDLVFRQKFYPEGNGYRSHTGGSTQSLPTLSPQEIREYHSKYYAPHNLCLFVTGRISVKSLLDRVQATIESRAILGGFNRGPKPKGWKRPFVETDSATVPIIKENMFFDIKMSEHSRLGEVLVAMVGPPLQDYATIEALKVLSIYLSKELFSQRASSIFSVPMRDCCSSISVITQLRAKFWEICVYMHYVEVAHLDRADSVLRRALKKPIKRGLQMEQLHTILDKRQSQWKMDLEQDGGSIFSEYILNDFVYGDDTVVKLEEALHWATTDFQLRSWTEKQWIDVIDKWLFKPKVLVIRSRPCLSESSKAQPESNSSDKPIVGKKFNNDPGMQDRKVGSEVIGQPISFSDHKISWISVQRASTVPDSDQLESGEAESAELLCHLEKDKCVLPLTLHFDHVPSHFVTITVYVSLDKIPDNMLPYLHTLRYNFFIAKLIHEDGTISKPHKLRAYLDKDLVSYSFDQDNKHSEKLCLAVVAETSKYSEAVRWIGRLLWSTSYSVATLHSMIEAIKMTTQKSLQRAKVVLDSAVTCERWGNSFMRTACFSQPWLWAPEIDVHLKKDPNAVLETLNSMKVYLLKPSNLEFSISGNVLGLCLPRSSWSEIFEDACARDEYDVDYKPTFLSQPPPAGFNQGKVPAQKAFLISLHTVANSHSYYCSHMSGYFSSESYALVIAQNILDGTEGPLWRQIRGAGLAYGLTAHVMAEPRMVIFEIIKSSDAFKAYQAAKKAIKDLVDGATQIDPQLLRAAKNGHIYSLVKKHSTPTATASERFVNRVLHGSSHTQPQDELAVIERITPEEVLGVIEKYFLPIFDPKTSAAFITCGPDQAERIGKEFEEEGYSVNFREATDDIWWKHEQAERDVKRPNWLSKLNSSIFTQAPDEKKSSA